jgi:hypothetical protein
VLAGGALVTLHARTGEQDASTVSSAALRTALQYLHDNHGQLGLTGADLLDVIATAETVSAHNGVTHVYLQQRYKGIEVRQGTITVSIGRDGRVLQHSGSFIGNLPSAINRESAGRDATTAATDAVANLDLSPTRGFEVKEWKGGPAQAVVLSDGGVSARDIPARLVYESVGPREVRLAWLVQVEEPGGDHWWEMTVDAETGQVLEQDDLIDHDDFGVPAAAGSAAAAVAAEGLEEANGLTEAYNVFAWPKESPYDGARTLETAPADLLASPFGWHDTNGAAGPEFTITRGNNVHAYTDLDANNVADPGSDPDGGVDLLFNFTLDLALGPETYRPAAVTNLFYWNNIVHDVFYQYGFDEASGNFQVNNYGRGGTGNDDVRAEAQDGSGTNNANFGTPVDGNRPRMQMFVWTGGLPYFVTVNDGPIAGNYTATGAAFGPSIDDIGPVTGNVVLVNDGAGASPTDGCEAFVIPAGSIALVDRGSCNFTVKVAFAQASGAVGVIVANNAPGSPITMGGTDPTITIPSVMVTQANGDLFKANLPFNATLRVNSDRPPNRDSDLDSGVIAHEYGHGISNRLTGGPATVSCLGNAEQMGEGWSDYTALVITATTANSPTAPRGIGNYVSFRAPDGPGIRPTPYTTDLSINPTTYGDIGGLAIPHGVGYAWATMLWEVYWNLVQVHGFNPNVYDSWDTGGNNLAIQLVIDGMKMQPCRPGFVDGRNAILAADMALTGGANQCLIWHGFAKRGLGFSASQGLNTSTTDGTEAFDLPASCGVETSPSSGRTVNAGSVVPVKFDLGLDYGLNIFAAGSPASRPVACDTSAPLGALEPTSTSGNSGVNGGNDGQYVYLWQTDPSWAGTCRELVVTLSDGVTFSTVYSFK